MTPMFRRWQPEEAEVAASFLTGDEWQLASFPDDDVFWIEVDGAVAGLRQKGALPPGLAAPRRDAERLRRLHAAAPGLGGRNHHAGRVGRRAGWASK